VIEVLVIWYKAKLPIDAATGELCNPRQVQVFAGGSAPWVFFMLVNQKVIPTNTT